MPNKDETEKIERVSEKTAYERFGKAVQGILIGGVVALFGWAWSLSTDVAILKSSQIKASDLKETEVEIKSFIKENFIHLETKTTKMLDDHEIRIRAIERKTAP